VTGVTLTWTERPVKISVSGQWLKIPLAQTIGLDSGPVGARTGDGR
jgi:hypothetical protein